MAVILKLKCPDCAETFKWPGDQKWPDFCPLCRSRLTNEVEEICMPFISSARAKSPDQVYRQMEAGSEVRAQAAADMLGVSTADVSDLKITNLKDNTHEGEMAHVPVVNDVSRMMDAAPDATGFQAMGAQLSSGTQIGPLPNVGAKFQTQLRRSHAQRAGWSAMSDNPSLEVQNPNYRRRA